MDPTPPGTWSRTSPLFRGFVVQEVRRSGGSTFRRFDVQEVRRLGGSMFRGFDGGPET
jgi:hypothetical protein